ncbi:restriction endonuclease subunit S [Mycoplasma feriruminatoris]|uniref:Restriction endonuclease subunit S n=1 Tax=Mycoplasma feriruminatoris TaxID=1179777 RepID=A0ABY8HX35_9MOLU|nr:restriction endonuclease subunit S [Mycoplasma feriruminatoris]WFQ93837.1 restriction endonuclease subunit S [Mycoplasma feriruminatoris]
MGKLVFYKTSSIILNNLNNNGKYCVYDANGIAGKIDIEPVSEEYISIIKDGAGAGRVRLLPKNTHILSTMGAILPLNTTDIKFVYFLLSKNSHLMKEASGSTIPHIYFKNYSQNIYIVPCNKEQYKISSLFSNLDSLITLHQRECNFWNLKKFEIKIHRFFTRFCKKSKKYTHTWEQEKLGKLVFYKTSSIILNNLNNNGKYCVYDANGIAGKIDIEPVSEEYISIIKDGAGAGRVRLLPKNTHILSTMGAILPLNTTDIKFVYFLLSKNSHLMKEASGSTIPHIYFKNYSQNIYIVPCNKEQYKISSLFSNLDSLITLHQWECNFWNLKKFEIKIHRFFTRFCKKSKKYTHTWEQCKVGEIFNIDRGLGITRKDMREIKFGNFKYPVYSSQTSDEGLIGYYTKYMTDNAITWTTDGVKAGTVFYRNHRFFATSHCGLLTKKQFEASQYFSIIISRNTSKYVTWVAMPMLTTSQMEKIAIICSLDQKEQSKISSLFSNLDSLITLHQRGYKWRENIWKKMIYCYTNTFKIE